MRPDYVDPWEAALVSQFVKEGEHGRWRIKHFTIDEEHYRMSQFRAMHEAGDDEFRREVELKRVIPPGEYCSLQRRATPTERADKPDLGITNQWYVPVMSDTPDEIEGHADAIYYAEGRVLIHGLGLGCLVSALLAKPEVTSIDVVDIDPDVLALTGHYYSGDPRVTIHQGDCVEVARNWSGAIAWDYVWHDIWTHISARNLDPAEAEHGIAYGTLFDLFPHAKRQGAWAYEEALASKEAIVKSREEESGWEDIFFAADEDTKVEMLFVEMVRSHLRQADGRFAYPKPQEIPQHLLDFFEANMPGIKEALRGAVRERGYSREAFEAWRAKPEPMGNPNDEIGTGGVRGSVR